MGESLSGSGLGSPLTVSVLALQWVMLSELGLASLFELGGQLEQPKGWASPLGTGSLSVLVSV